MALEPLNTSADYRFYTDASMSALQRMYNTSTGQWQHALWWQQANALETTIDYSLQTHTDTYTTDIAITFNHNKNHNFLDAFYNANAIWDHDRDSSNNLGLHWDGPFDLVLARRQSSAIDTLNAANDLGRHVPVQRSWSGKLLAYGLPAQRKQLLELVR